MKRVLTSLLLVLLLLCGVTNRAEAFSTPPEKTASGSLSQNPDKRTYVDPLLVLGLQRDREVWGYDLGLGVDVGPNLYAYVNQNPWSYFDPFGLDKNYTGPVEPDGKVDRKNDNKERAQKQNEGYDIDIHSSSEGFDVWYAPEENITARRDGDRLVDESGTELNVTESAREQYFSRISNSNDGTTKVRNPAHIEAEKHVNSHPMLAHKKEMFEKHGGFYVDATPAEIAEDVVSDPEFARDYKKGVYINGCDCGSILNTPKGPVEAPAKTLSQELANQSNRTIPKVVTWKGSFHWKRRSGYNSTGWERSSTGGRIQYDNVTPETGSN